MYNLAPFRVRISALYLSFLEPVLYLVIVAIYSSDIEALKKAHLEKFAFMRLNIPKTSKSALNKRYNRF